MIVLLIIEATGIATKGFKKNLETIPGKHSIDSILGTTYTIWNYCSLKLEAREGGSLFFKTSTKEKRPVTGDDIIIMNIQLFLYQYSMVPGDYH